MDVNTVTSNATQRNATEKSKSIPPVFRQETQFSDKVGYYEIQEENHANFLDGYEDVKYLLKGMY